MKEYSLLQLVIVELGIAQKLKLREQKKYANAGPDASKELQANIIKKKKGSLREKEDYISILRKAISIMI